MVVAALVISILALIGCALVALAVMELIADRGTSPSSRPSQDTMEEFEVNDAVAGTLASSHGLPAAIDGTESHLALFISPMCTMCAGIAESFGGELPDDVTVVVTASHPARQRQWASAHGLPSDEVVFDAEMSIVNGLGIASSPTVVGFGSGRVAFMAGIGGRPALDKLLAQRATTLESVAAMIRQHGQSDSAASDSAASDSAASDSAASDSAASDSAASDSAASDSAASDSAASDSAASDSAGSGSAASRRRR